jgi:hypothetical protein
MPLLGFDQFDCGLGDESAVGAKELHSENSSPAQFSFRWVVVGLIRSISLIACTYERFNLLCTLSGGVARGLRSVCLTRSCRYDRRRWTGRQILDAFENRSGFQMVLRLLAMYACAVYLVRCHE